MDTLYGKKCCDSEILRMVACMIDVALWLINRLQSADIKSSARLGSLWTSTKWVLKTELVWKTLKLWGVELSRAHEEILFVFSYIEQLWQPPWVKLPPNVNQLGVWWIWIKSVHEIICYKTNKNWWKHNVKCPEWCRDCTDFKRVNLFQLNIWTTASELHRQFETSIPKLSQ